SDLSSSAAWRSGSELPSSLRPQLCGEFLNQKLRYRAVTVGLVSAFQTSASSGACPTLDPRDTLNKSECKQPEDDTGIFCWCHTRIGSFQCRSVSELLCQQ